MTDSRTWGDCARCGYHRSTIKNGLCRQCRSKDALPTEQILPEGKDHNTHVHTSHVVVDKVELIERKPRWWQFGRNR